MKKYSKIDFFNRRSWKKNIYVYEYLANTLLCQYFTQSFSEGLYRQISKPLAKEYIPANYFSSKYNKKSALTLTKIRKTQKLFSV